jgi:hypothetical protein
MKKFTVSLTAGDSRQITVKGNYFRALSANDPFVIEFSDGTKSEFLGGLGVRVPSGFDWVRIESKTAQDVEFMAGNGQIDDNRLLGTVGISGSINAVGLAANSANYGAVSVSTTATLIKAATASRKTLLVQPLDGDIYFGSDASVTTSNGVLIRQLTGMVIENVGDVYAIAAAATDVRFFEEVN